MKKRIISMLLSVLMVMSLFSGMTASASAITTPSGANLVEYTMAQGDYVLRICQRLGLNYYTCKEAIMYLNGINDGQWNKLAVGRTLIMPASDYDALLVTKGSSTTGTATTGTATTGTATTGIASTSATSSTVNTYNSSSGGDILAYYLVPYTMSYGETVSGVCNSLGVNFSVFSSFIQSVNGISNWTKVRAGDTLIIPTPVCPSVGTTCYAVMMHKVVANDTAYSIATANGLNFNASKRLLEALNQTSNLGALKVGDNFLYPRPMTVSVAGTGNPGNTATTTTTTTTTNGNGTTTTTSTTTSALYKLTSSMSSSDGTLLFYVDGKPVTAAPAGAKVTVVSETASHKAVSSLTVKYSNGQADLQLTGDTFIMPSCDVRVDALIKTGHDIKISSNYSGKASASVNGVSVLSAVKGAAVVIRSTDPNYEIQSIDAYYMKQVSSDNKTKLAVSASNAFLMPDADAYVEVTLKPVSTYAFYVSCVDALGNPSDAGSFYLQVNGNAVTRAAKGAQVTVVTRSLDGYEATGLSVTRHGTTQVVNTFSNTFTMPGFDVDVVVTFGAKGNNIVILPGNGGTVVAQVGGNTVDEADTGATVTLVATPDDASYTIDSYDVVRNSDGLKVTVTAAGTFIMPKGGVTVTPVFRGTAHVITSNLFISGNAVGATYKNVSFSTSITRNGQTFRGEFTADGQTSNDTVTARRQLNNNVFYGDYIDLRYDCAVNIAFIRYDITTTSTNPTILEQVEQAINQANLHGYFQMPDADITIRAYFDQGKVAIGQYAVIRGDGDVSYTDVATGRSVAACMPGDVIRLTPKASHGYRWAGTNTNYADRIIVTRKDNGAILPLTPVNVGGTWCYDFTMPAEGVYILVAFDPLPFTLTMRAIDEAGNILNGQGLWQIAINGAVGAVDNNPGAPTQVSVEYGDAVVVGMTESGISKYDMVGFRIDGREYIADVKNYFYNFSMVEERAKDLDIVAVLRPKTPYQVGLYSLSANYDADKGNVEFLLLDRNPLDPNTAMPTNPNDPTQQTSTTQYGVGHYSTVNMTTQNINPASYEKAAVAGDYVAIVVDTPNPMYSVTADDITIYEYEGDSNRIIPSVVNGWTISGVAKTFYVFQMPHSPVGIWVNFTSQNYSLTVSVRDENGNPVSQGYIQVSTGQSYRDVAADTTFDNVGYGNEVRIDRTELARAQNMKIKSVEVLTADPSITVTYYDDSGSGEGISFFMPNVNVTVRIQVEKSYDETAVVLFDQVYNGSLIFRDALGNLVTNFKVGDVVYVYDVPDPGYTNLGLGELKIYNNGMFNTVNYDTVMGAWKFTVLPGTTIFGAVFQPAGVTVNVSVTLNGAPTTLNIFVNGNVCGTGDTFPAEVGDSLHISSAESGYAVNGATDFLVPNVGTFNLTVDLTATGNKITVNSSDWNVSPVITATSGSNPIDINNVDTGTPVTITASDSDKYVVKNVAVTSAVDGTYITDGSTSVTFPMPAGGAVVTVTYELRTVNVSFAIPAGFKVLVSINGATATEYDSTITGAIALKVDDNISYWPKDNAFQITSVTDGLSANNYNGGYNVPNTTAAVTLTFTCTP